MSYSTTVWTAKAQALPQLLPGRSLALRTRSNRMQRAIRKARKKRRKRRRNTRNTKRRKTKNIRGRLTAAPHLPLLPGPDTRDILTSLPALRGSGNIARTVEGIHPADDKTEALMTENGYTKGHQSPGCQVATSPLPTCPTNCPSVAGIRQVAAPQQDPEPSLLDLRIYLAIWRQLLQVIEWVLGYQSSGSKRVVLLPCPPAKEDLTAQETVSAATGQALEVRVRVTDYSFFVCVSAHFVLK